MLSYQCHMVTLAEKMGKSSKNNVKLYPPFCVSKNAEELLNKYTYLDISRLCSVINVKWTHADNHDKIFGRHAVRGPLTPHFCLSPLRFKPHLNSSSFKFLPSAANGAAPARSPIIHRLATGHAHSLSGCNPRRLPRPIHLGPFRTQQRRRIHIPPARGFVGYTRQSALVQVQDRTRHLRLPAALPFPIVVGLGSSSQVTLSRLSPHVTRHASHVTLFS